MSTPLISSGRLSIKTDVSTPGSRTTLGDLSPPLSSSTAAEPPGSSSLPAEDGLPEWLREAEEIVLQDAAEGFCRLGCGRPVDSDELTMSFGECAVCSQRRQRQRALERSRTPQPTDESRVREVLASPDLRRLLVREAGGLGSLGRLLFDDLSEDASDYKPESIRALGLADSAQKSAYDDVDPAVALLGAACFRRACRAAGVYEDS